MPVDASIPLQMQQFQPAQAQQNAMSFAEHMQQSRLMQMQVAQQQQQLKNQMLMSKMASEPGNMDSTTGLWTPDALNKLSQANPVMGMEIRQNQVKSQYAVEQLALERAKGQEDSFKLQKEAIKDARMEAISAGDAAPPGQAEDAYQKVWNEQRQRLEKSGLFGESTQFSDLNYSAAKKHAVSFAAQKNPVQQIEDARDQVDELKKQYSQLPNPGVPEAKVLQQKITDGEAAISRMKAPTNTMIDMGNKIPSGYEKDPSAPGKLRAIPGGPADKDKHDVLQADALAAYRASYPMGYMGNLPGSIYKNQPTPEDYVAEYIKNKTENGKGMPKASVKPMPKEQSGLVKDSIYQTKLGPAKWNGKQFERIE